MSLAWTQGNKIDQSIKWELKGCKQNILTGIFDSTDYVLGTTVAPPVSPMLVTVPAQVRREKRKRRGERQRQVGERGRDSDTHRETEKQTK